MHLLELALAVFSWCSSLLPERPQLTLYDPTVALSALQSPKSYCDAFTYPSSLSRKTTVNATLLSTRYYAANATLQLNSSSGEVDASIFPAFCRLVFDIHTNPSNAKAKARTEVWLPDASEWTGRLIGFGNAGWSGGVNYGDLAYIALAGHHAGFSTNGGHTSPSNNGSWALDNPDALIDFGGRAMHLSALLAKDVVELFYGTEAGKSYYVGCSTGGREGLKEIQDYPEDFDGVVIGSPANWLTHMHPWSLHIQQQVLPEGSAQWISDSLWKRLHELALAQCDCLDGVCDGIINDPRNCSFRPEEIACTDAKGYSDTMDENSTCVNSKQLAALKIIYNNFTIDGTYIFGPLMPGGELEYPHALLNSKPFGTAIDYFKYMVLNNTNWTEANFTLSDVHMADVIDPGNMNAVQTDLSAYAGPAHNGKIIHYVGWEDQYISPMNSLHYYETVKTWMGANTDLDIADYYRLFTVPGMRHCYSGNGANAFGGAQQAEKGMPPGKNDTSHNVLLALIDWVENGIEPESFIATKYKDDNVTQGVEFTRPICQVGQYLLWDGNGNVNHSSSWTCA